MGRYRVNDRVSKEEIEKYNNEQVLFAYQRCKGKFLGKNNSNIYTVYFIEDPNKDERECFSLFGDYVKNDVISEEAEYIETKSETRTDYTTTGYSGTVDSDGNINIHEDYSSIDYTVYFVSKITNRFVSSEFVYVKSMIGNMNALNRGMNSLMENYNGYRWVGKISTIKIRFTISWILALLDCLLVFYFAIPLFGELAILANTENPNVVAAFAMSHSFMFWPTFVLSLLLKVISVVLIGRPNTQTNFSYVKRIIIYTLFVIYVLSLLFIFKLFSENATVLTGFIFIALLGLFVFLLFVQLEVVVKWRSKLKTSIHQIIVDVANFKEIFVTTENYRLKIQEVKELLV